MDGNNAVCLAVAVTMVMLAAATAATTLWSLIQANPRPSHGSLSDLSVHNG